MMLLFCATIVPTVLGKASAPHWFHLVSYAMRMHVAARIMGVVFVVAAICHELDYSYGLALGMAVVAVQSGLGEASLFALAGKLDKEHSTIRQRQSSPNGNADCNDLGGGSIKPVLSVDCMTSFSSGDGLSVAFAYFWKVLVTEWLGWSWEAMLLSCVLLAASYHHVFVKYLAAAADIDHESQGAATATTTIVVHGNDHDASVDEQVGLQEEKEHALLTRKDLLYASSSSSSSSSSSLSPCHEWTLQQRLYQMCTLWPYAIPLFTVFTVERTMSGAWSATGFPATNVDSRMHFARTASWFYQVGNIISRSSGTMLTVPLPVLWILSLLQCANLAFFTVAAASYAATVLVTMDDSDQETVTPTYWLYSPMWMYGMCLYAGLLGGAVFVHVYKRIVKDKPAREVEFAVAATSVAESIGMVVAKVGGLLLQSCLYKANGIRSAVLGIRGAVVSCPI